MAAPAHYLADEAENNAKRYARELIKALEKRVAELERIVRHLCTRELGL